MHNVKAKYQQMDFVVKALALKKDRIAMTSGNEDNWLLTQDIKFDYHSSDPITFGQPRTPTQPRRAINLVAWSPNGKLLATAFDRLTIWEELDDFTLTKVHDFKEHSLEITAMTWSQDGTKVVTCSLDSKIVVVDVFTKTRFKEIDCGNKVVGIVWDPFDKYVACLRFDNTVMVWKVVTWELFATVCLNFPHMNTAEKYTSKREDRKIDWSPDFRYLLVPSLDDRVVPVVCALDRHHSFKVSQTFLGPFSSVNAVRFSPVIYQQADSISTVFAMGDNDGNISVWRLSEKAPDKPLILLKNPAGELIEDIMWSADGKVLMATTMKRYIIMAVFEGEGVLGHPLSQNDKDTYLNQTYGGTKQINLSSQNAQGIQISIPLYQPITVELPQELRAFQKIQPQETQANTYTQTPQLSTFNQSFTAQQTIIQNGKKKIIPQMQIINKQEVASQPQLTQVSQQPVPTRVLPFLTIKQPSLLPIHYVYQLPQNVCLTLDNTLIKCIRSRGANNSEEVLWADQLESRIRLIQCSSEYVCMYTENSLLYISSRVGRRLLPPVVMPTLCHMCLDEYGNLLLVQENGDFKVLQLQEQRVLIEGDMRSLLQHVYKVLHSTNTTNDERSMDPITSVFLSKGVHSCIPNVVLKTNELFSYSREFGLWVRVKRIEIQQSEQTHNEVMDKQVSIATKPVKQNDSFYSRLVMEDPQQRFQEALNDIQQIAKVEELLSQLILSADLQQFCIQSYLYIKKLCDTLPLNSERLHDYLMKLLINNKAKEYNFLQTLDKCHENVQRNVLCILKQFPTASQFVYLIEQ